MTTPKILDFSNGKKVPPIVVVYPVYDRIAGYSLSINAYPNGVIRINVGCKSLSIDKNNIDDILAEYRGESRAKTTEKIIVEKVPTKSTSSLSSKPRLKDECGKWLISVADKAYDKAMYEVKEIEVSPKKKYFVVGKQATSDYKYRNGNYPLYYVGGNGLPEADAKRIGEILVKCKEFLSEEV
jgi:hypothetical protein